MKSTAGRCQTACRDASGVSPSRQDHHPITSHSRDMSRHEPARSCGCWCCHVSDLWAHERCASVGAHRGGVRRRAGGRLINVHQACGATHAALGKVASHHGDSTTRKHTCTEALRSQFDVAVASTANDVVTAPDSERESCGVAGTPLRGTNDNMPSRELRGLHISARLDVRNKHEREPHQQQQQQKQQQKHARCQLRSPVGSRRPVSFRGHSLAQGAVHSPHRPRETTLGMRGCPRRSAW